MPGVLKPEFPGMPEFNPLNPTMWEEEVGDRGKREDTVAVGESLCTLRGYVLSHELLLPALVYWLGYSYVNYNPFSADYLKVRRKLPAPHPELTQLFANRIRIMGFKYKDKIRIPAPPGELFGAKVPFARYDRYYLEIDFGMTDYAVLPDGYINTFGEPITEWERFTSVVPADDTEILTVDGGTYVYKSVPGFPNLPLTMINGPLLRKVVERTELVITVRQLPYDLIFDGYNIPRRLMKAKGRVNSDVFLGHNTQTMLLVSWKPVKYPQPVATQTWTQLQFGVDLEFRFSYQEPKKAIWNETQAGWNLYPLAGMNWDNGWFGVISKQGNNPIYSSVGFTTLLNHWADLPVY